MTGRTTASGQVPCVLLGGATNALSVARSLWDREVPVDVLGGSTGDPPARWSRATRRYVRADPGVDPAESWFDWLSREAAPSVILACSDEGLEFIAKHRRDLESLGHRPAEADDEVVLAMLDKRRTYELAYAAGIAAPRTLALSSPDDLGDLDDFTYPCAVKPVESHVFARRFRPLAKGAHVRDASQARAMLEPILAQGVAMLLTEVVAGTDDCCSYYSYLDEHGEPLVHFTKLKLRQYPTRFGLGTYHLTKWQPDVAELGLSFFKSIGLRGMGNVEFKRDRRDGLLKLIECNPRFTNAQEQVRAAGIDFGLLSYARATGTDLPPLDRFRDDVGLWFPLGDIRALRQYRQDGEWTIASWMRSLAHRQVFPLWSPGDPAPSLRNATAHAGGLARRIGRRASGSSSTPTITDPYDVASSRETFEDTSGVEALDDRFPRAAGLG